MDLFIRLSVVGIIIIFASILILIIIKTFQKNYLAVENRDKVKLAFYIYAGAIYFIITFIWVTRDVFIKTFLPPVTDWSTMTDISKIIIIISILAIWTILSLLINDTLKSIKEKLP